jgi:hypothetical protein
MGGFVRHAWFVCTLIATVLFTVSLTLAHEPDGRFAIDYKWLADPAQGSPRPLRITVTAIVPLKDVRITGKTPASTSLGVRTMQWAGAPAAGAPWPDAGVGLGAVAAGQTIVFELEVIEPEHGGGVLVFGVDASDERAGGRAVHEGIGITVGLPGVAPRMRNGVWEFPAERGAPSR